MIEKGELVLTSLEMKVLNCLLIDPTLSRAAIAGQLGIGRDTVKEYFSRLRRKELLRRGGSSRSGFWMITETGMAIIKEKSL